MDAPNAVLARRAIRFDQAAPAGTTLTSGGVLSPDGRYLAFIARHVTTARPGCGCARSNPRAPASWRAPRVRSARSGRRTAQSLAFFADGRLKRISVAGGPPQTLATVGYRPSGGSWSSNGLILYSDRMSPDLRDARVGQRAR